MDLLSPTRPRRYALVFPLRLPLRVRHHHPNPSFFFNILLLMMTCVEFCDTELLMNRLKAFLQILALLETH